MDKLTMILGGEERVMQFGRVGFYSYIEEASGIDPLEWFEKITKGDKKIVAGINDAAICAFAGINTHLDLIDQEPVSFERVRRWVNGLKSEDVSTIVKAAFDAFATKSEEKKSVA